MVQILLNFGPCGAPGITSSLPTRGDSASWGTQHLSALNIGGIADRFRRDGTQVWALPLPSTSFRQYTSLGWFFLRRGKRIGMSSRSGRGDTRANGDIDSLPLPRSAPVILPPPDPHLDHPLSDMDKLMAMVAKSTAMVAKSAADLAAMTASPTARWDGLDERDKERLLTRHAKQFTSLGRILRRGKRIGYTLSLRLVLNRICPSAVAENVTKTNEIENYSSSLQQIIWLQSKICINTRSERKGASVLRGAIGKRLRLGVDRARHHDR